MGLPQPEAGKALIALWHLPGSGVQVNLTCGWGCGLHLRWPQSDGAHRASPSMRLAGLSSHCGTPPGSGVQVDLICGLGCRLHLWWPQSDGVHRASPSLKLAGLSSHCGTSLAMGYRWISPVGGGVTFTCGGLRVTETTGPAPAGRGFLRTVTPPWSWTSPVGRGAVFGPPCHVSVIGSECNASVYSSLLGKY